MPVTPTRNEHFLYRCGTVMCIFMLKLAYLHALLGHLPPTLNKSGAK